MREGVIKFAAQHDHVAVSNAEAEAVTNLLGWRAILCDLGLVGADPGRYGGVGFGNVSHRAGARSTPRGRRAFVVSGTQTAGLDVVTADHFACVTEWSVRDNSLRSRGLVMPSSEALTHATIYDEGPHLQAVLHVHSPEIWRAQARLRLPTTPPDVDYGTVAMAEATSALFRAGLVQEVGLFVMRGHEDGVVAFGRTVDEAGATLVRTLAAARI